MQTPRAASSVVRLWAIRASLLLMTAVAGFVLTSPAAHADSDLLGKVTHDAAHVVKKATSAVHVHSKSTVHRSAVGHSTGRSAVRRSAQVVPVRRLTSPTRSAGPVHSRPVVRLRVHQPVRLAVHVSTRGHLANRTPAKVGHRTAPTRHPVKRLAPVAPAVGRISRPLSPVVKPTLAAVLPATQRAAATLDTVVGKTPVATTLATVDTVVPVTPLVAPVLAPITSWPVLRPVGSVLLPTPPVIVRPAVAAAILGAATAAAPEPRSAGPISPRPLPTHAAPPTTTRSALTFAASVVDTGSRSWVGHSLDLAGVGMLGTVAVVSATAAAGSAAGGGSAGGMALALLDDGLGLVLTRTRRLFASLRLASWLLVPTPCFSPD